jgi:hypothetical protein
MIWAGGLRESVEVLVGCIPDPREAERIIYAEVVRCACEQREMATCDDLSDLLGGSAVSTTVGILQRLERKGVIRIKRFQRSRQVYVVELDKWTREPSNTVPHWRDIPRPTNLPTVSIHTYAQRRQDEAMLIQTEARKLGKMPADFIADLIHAGWHEYLASKVDDEMVRAA